MNVINDCARLITINFKGEKYRLLPAGQPVEMPDEAKKDSEFFKSMVADGSVKILPKSAAKATDEGDDDPLADLRAEAIELGVEKVTKVWGKAKLEAAIEEAKADIDPAE